MKYRESILMPKMLQGIKCRLYLEDYVKTGGKNGIIGNHRNKIERCKF